MKKIILILIVVSVACVPGINAEPAKEDFSQIYGQAHLNFVQKNYDKSWSLCQKAMKLDPENYKLFVLAGNIHLGQRKFKEAIPYLSKAILLKPNDGMTYVFRSGCYWEMGQKQQAIQDAKKAVEVDPDCTQCLMVMQMMTSK